MGDVTTLRKIKIHREIYTFVQKNHKIYDRLLGPKTLIAVAFLITPAAEEALVRLLPLPSPEESSRSLYERMSVLALSASSLYCRSSSRFEISSIRDRLVDCEVGEE